MLSVAGVVALGSATPGDTHPAQETRQRIALIVAIGDYPPETGYAPLASLNDVPMVVAGLRAQGFDASDIHVLPQHEATLDGLRRAFQTRLIDRARPGDIVFVHYSGHGHRITDDGTDELDGYDEVLVPIDAPNLGRLPVGYSGERHLRDDELGALLTRLRRRLGPRGELLVTIDACFSGSATRARQVLGVRGSADPIGPPAGQAAEADPAGGLFEPPPASTRGEDDGLAPYVLISASRHDQLNHEIRSEDGTVVGPLSYAFGRVLSRLHGRGSPTYRMLFEEIEGVMASKVRYQSPQIEGDVDRKLFDGAPVTQRPYFDVASHEGVAVVIEGGTVHGIFPGSSVEFHEWRTVDPRAVRAVAAGTVTTAGPATSRVTLEAPTTRSLGNLLAFVTEYGFPSMTLGVWVSDAVSPPLASRLREAMAATSALSLVREPHAAELIVDTVWVGGRAADGVAVRAAADYAVIGGPYAQAPVEEVVERARLYALNRYLRGLDAGATAAPGFAARLEFVPARFDPQRAEGCASDEARATEYRTPGGGIALRAIDEELDGADEASWAWYKLRIHNEGDSAFHATVLDLMPDGRIEQLFPHSFLTGADNQVPAGRSYEVPLCYYALPPAGQEVLKLMATAAPVNFSSLVTPPPPPPRAERSAPAETAVRDPLRLFGATLPLVRSEGRASATFVVDEVTLTILPRSAGRR